MKILFKVSIIATLIIGNIYSVNALAAGKTAIKEGEKTKVTSSVKSPRAAIDSWMLDKNLQSMVANSLKKPVANITQNDMLQLTTIDFNSLPMNTQVDLTGLEFATNLQEIDTTQINATQIPELTIAPDAFIFTKPNVLKYIHPKGFVVNLCIGYFDKLLSQTEIGNIGQYINNWSMSTLSVCSTNIKDYSTLGLDFQVAPPLVSLLSYDYCLNPVILAPITITSESQTDILYSDNTLKDIGGKPLLSNSANIGRQADVYYVTKEGDEELLMEGKDYDYVANGIHFYTMPINAQSIIMQYNLPSYFSSMKNEESNIFYGLRAEIPLVKKIPAGNVTVNYVDTQGNEIEAAQIISGYIGEQYKTTAATIKGWNLKTTPDNANGKFTKESQAVTYIYEKANGGNITVNYQDVNGHKLAKSKILTGKYGEPYITSAEEIKNYTLAKEPVNATGTFSESAQTVTYVYEKVEESKSDDPANSGASKVDPSSSKKDESFVITPQTNSSTSKSSVTNKKITKKVKLPSTGDSLFDGIIYSLLGILLFFSALYVLMNRRQKKVKHNK